MKGMSRLLWWLSSGYRSALIKSALGAIVAVGLTVGICALGNGARLAIQDQLMGGGDHLEHLSDDLSCVIFQVPILCGEVLQN